MIKETKDVWILVVDDEDALRHFLAFDLKRKGFNVIEAGNGRDAFELVKKHKFDVVISDVRMPGGDGVELLDNIKNYHPGIPVVMFITGFADLTLEDAYDKGADAVFAKPFDRKELLGSVQKAITSKDELWGSRQNLQNNANFNIELRFPELNRALEGKLLSIGRGGMFVALQRDFPHVGAKTEFEIKFQQGAISGIHGNGIVRWVREQPLEHAETGCGIEFEYLHDATRDQIIAFIESLRAKAFIPKGITR